MTDSIDSDLIKILSNLSVSVDTRCQGWGYLLGLTASEDGLNYIIQSDKYIPFLVSSIEAQKLEETTLILALKCLINISNHETGTSAIFGLKTDLLEKLISIISGTENKFIQYVCYVLSNVSSHPGYDQKLTDLLLTSEGMLKTLMDWYCSKDLAIRGKYDFLTLVFANISRLPTGRRLLMEDGDFIVRLLTFIKETEPEVRRLGGSLILRNCCSEIDNHEVLLEKFSILPALLLPLMDSKEYDDDEMNKLPIECQCLEESKMRDPNASVRRVLVQALTALCYSKKGWDYLQAHGAYYVVRDLHLWETDEKVKDTIENLVPYFLVEEYASPDINEQSSGDDHLLIQQLEADIVRDLPDFVV